MVIICFERSKILDYPVYLHSETYIKLRLASQGAKLLTSIDGQDNHNNILSSELSRVLVNYLSTYVLAKSLLCRPLKDKITIELFDY